MTKLQQSVPGRQMSFIRLEPSFYLKQCVHLFRDEILTYISAHIKHKIVLIVCGPLQSEFFFLLLYQKPDLSAQNYCFESVNETESLKCNRNEKNL